MVNPLLKEKIKKRLIAENSAQIEEKDIAALKERAGIILENIIRSDDIRLTPEIKEKLIAELVDEVAGFGPLEQFLRDPQVTEIMVNGPGSIFVERHGKMEPAGIAFESEQQLMQVIYKFLEPTRRRVDEAFPYTEIALQDGSRVNIIIPPLSLDGPVITIRKFLKSIRTAEDLIKLGTLDNRMRDFLVACVKAKINIIFSGATGAGKTTTLNVLSSYINADERIITIEDTAELNLNQRHVVRLETRHPTIEGKGEVGIRELFRNSLRMRPDRIIIGEIRGQEAFDMLQAVCSGHTGALTLLHASSPQEVIYRLEAMILTSGMPINVEAIHRLIAAAVNVIVHEEQLADGSRKITYITQVNGLKDAQAACEDIFLYDQEGIDAAGKVKGSWKATGIIPVFYPLFAKRDVNLNKEIFKQD